MPEIQRTLLHLEADQVKQLKHIALDRGIRYSELVRQIVRSYLQDKGGDQGERS